jgi:23S rRNA G2445 N2-methylase RlmL
MHAELIRVATRALGRRPPEPRKEGTGQLVYPFDPELAQVAVAYLRTATRVVHDLYRSTRERLEPLYDELVRDIAADHAALDKHARTLSVAVRRVGEFAAGERQVIGVVKNALIDALRQRAVTTWRGRAGARPNCRSWCGSMTPATWSCRSTSAARRCRSVAGAATHGEAPMREHLAAVLLMLVALRSASATLLVDPMCGAGTIPIEAVLAARATPRPLLPVARKLADRPCDAPLFADAAPLVAGADADLAVLVAAKANAQAAGVAADVTWERADVQRLAPGGLRAGIDEAAARRGRKVERGLILSNPPYGERLGDGHDDPALMDLYANLGARCRALGAGWRAGFLVANLDFERAFGPPPRIKKPLANGNLRSYFYLYEF